MENSILEEVHKTYTIKIVHDNYPMNPRTEWDNLGRMVCFHSNYDLGDKHDFTVESLKEFIISDEVIISYPLYLYDHSGITISISPFSCQWDSGQIGYIYVTKEDVKKEFNIKKITKKYIETSQKILKNEVKVYDNYLTGQVYGFEIYDHEGDIIDSCGGFYDEPQNILEDCKKTIDNYYDYQLALPFN